MIGLGGIAAVLIGDVTVRASPDGRATSVGDGIGIHPTPTPTPAPISEASRALAAHFLAEWVDRGRVIRRDQGGDTVSEGQAYGMLLAIVADDPSAFEAIWNWTVDHLRRADGLLAWHWRDGVVIDPQPATDADLDAARALILAGSRWGHPEWGAAGVSLAGAISRNLTASTAAGRILLPGVWANRAPFAYNPSYAAPASFEILAGATGDPIWHEIASGTRTATARLLASSRLLPDWAQAGVDGSFYPTSGAADTGPPPAYGYDAARLPLRSVEACAPEDRLLARQLATRLPSTQDLPMVLTLDGAAAAPDRHPLAYMGRAAARAAIGDVAGAEADLGTAMSLEAQRPSYYGAAWVALGTALLKEPALGGCPPLANHP